MQIKLTHGCILGPQSADQKSAGQLNCGKAGEVVNIADDKGAILIALGMATKPENKAK